MNVPGLISRFGTREKPARWLTGWASQVFDLQDIVEWVWTGLGAELSEAFWEEVQVFAGSLSKAQRLRLIALGRRSC